VVVPALRGAYRAPLLGAALAAFLALGLLGVYRYIDNYWLYRGFAPPRDPAYVHVKGTATRFYLASPALGGRRQPIDVYLPPGYATHPNRRYPVMYMLHGVPGRPGAFLATVRAGVLVDELVAKHILKPMILVMPFGSTGSFTDEEWANGVSTNSAWETFLARDVVRAVDHHYRTIPHGRARALVGLSEGGYGAFNIGLHHPGEFRVLESWSGYENADNVGSVFGHQLALLQANSPALTLQAAAAKLRHAHTFFWFYSGTDDRYRIQNAAFADALGRAGLAHRFFMVRGGHNWALWRDNAARALLAASKRLRIA
jgi:enterochelin esterase-like enzyme